MKSTADMSVWYAVCKVCHQPFRLEDLNLDTADATGVCDGCVKGIPPPAPDEEQQRYL
jgi:hypothetical protein